MLVECFIPIVILTDDAIEGKSCSTYEQAKNAIDEYVKTCDRFMYGVIEKRFHDMT